MPLRTISWLEHRRLLQGRHGRQDLQVGRHRVRMSLNKAFYCGALAIEMALELRPNMVASRFLDELILREDDIKRGRQPTWWPNENGDDRFIFLALTELAEIAVTPIEQAYDAIVRNAGRYAYSAISSDEYSREQWVNDVWFEEVEHRCAERLPFIRPGSSQISMAAPRQISWFLRGFIDAALQFSLDPEGEPLSQYYNEFDISPECLQIIMSQCQEFINDNATRLEASGLSEEQQGRNFWLSRNGGDGFKDPRLAEEALQFGSIRLYVGDYGLLDCRAHWWYVE